MLNVAPLGLQDLLVALLAVNHAFLAGQFVCQLLLPHTGLGVQAHPAEAKVLIVVLQRVLVRRCRWEVLLLQGS